MMSVPIRGSSCKYYDEYLIKELKYKMYNNSD